VGLDEPGGDAGDEAAETAGDGAEFRLAFPAEGEGCGEDGATDDEAARLLVCSSLYKPLLCGLPHHQEEPAEIDTDGVPDAGKGGHHETEEADHNVRNEYQLFRCGGGLDVGLVDVEGYCPSLAP